MRFSKKFYPICILTYPSVTKAIEAMGLCITLFWDSYYGLLYDQQAVCVLMVTLLATFIRYFIHFFFSIKRESFLSSHRCLVSFIRCMTRGNFLETKRHFCFVPYYTQAHFAKKNSSNRIFWPKKIKLLLLGSPNTMNKYL